VITERLYYSDSYLLNFTADVVGQSDGGRRVYLNRTAFYPTSGGQPFDTGLLGGVRVMEVEEEEERIAHLLEAPLKGARVEGVVDWSRRFDHMQQHTGQHLLSAVLEELFHYRTVSVHFGAETATLDLDADSLTPEDIRRAEERANAIVFENRPVTVAFEDAATATGLRKETDRTGTIRIVTIEDLDRSACGGTHVRATGEVGAILIRKAERVKKQTRLEFRCGGRAIARARSDLAILSNLAAASSAAIEDLPALLEKQRGELKAAVALRRAMEEDLIGHRARDLYHQATPDESGRRVVVYRAQTASAEELGGLAQALTALPKVAFLGTLTTPPTLFLSSSPDTGLDAGAILKPVLAALEGRGGGSARLARGTVPGSDALEAALARLTEVISTTG
jgi:alanyl-tRNA synthetase